MFTGTYYEQLQPDIRLGRQRAVRYKWKDRKNKDIMPPPPHLWWHKNKNFKHSPSGIWTSLYLLYWLGSNSLVPHFSFRIPSVISMTSLACCNHINIQIRNCCPSQIFKTYTCTYSDVIKFVFFLNKFDY